MHLCFSEPSFFFTPPPSPICTPYLYLRSRPLLSSLTLALTITNPQVGFSVAASGSVLFNFEKKARLCLTTEIDEDSMIEVAMEADVDDCELEAPNEDKVQTFFLQK